MEIEDKWISTVRWFRPLTNRINTKIITVLSSLDTEGSSVEARVYDVVSLSEALRETRERCENHCRKLLEAGLIESPNGGYIKGQRGFIKKRDILPEVQLTSDGILAAKMIHAVRSRENLSVSSRSIDLQLLGQLEHSLEKIQDLVKKAREKED